MLTARLMASSGTDLVYFPVPLDILDQRLMELAATINFNAYQTHPVQPPPVIPNPQEE